MQRVKPYPPIPFSRLSEFRFPAETRSAISELLPAPHRAKMLTDMEAAAAIYLFKKWRDLQLKAVVNEGARQDLRRRAARIEKAAAKLLSEIDSLGRATNKIAVNLFQGHLGGAGELRTAVSAVKRLQSAAATLEPPRPRGIRVDYNLRNLQINIAAIMRAENQTVSKARGGQYARILQTVYEGVGLGVLDEPFLILRRVHSIKTDYSFFTDLFTAAQEDLDWCVESDDIVRNLHTS